MSHADAIAAAVALEWRKPFEPVADEVLDDCYLHPSTTSVDAAPDRRRFAGRWLGTVGEHLARRRGVAVLAWIDRPQHFRLTAPAFFLIARAAGLLYSRARSRSDGGACS